MSRHTLKLVFIGGLTFCIAAIVVAIVMAPLIEGPLDEIYLQNADLWRTGVIGDGFNETSVFVYWVLHKAIYAFCMALLYVWSRNSIPGSGWLKGGLLGLLTVPMVASTYLGMWTVMTLPAALWLWWGFFYLISGTLSGAAMGFCVEKVDSN